MKTAKQHNLWLLPTTLAVAAGMVSGLRAAPPDAAEVGNPEITAPEIVAHVKYLASEELAGRGSGTPGGRLAAKYMAERFEAAGLKPGGDNGTWFQKFEFTSGVKLGPGNALTVSAPPAKPRMLVLNRDFKPLSFSNSKKVEAGVVFASYGINAPALQYNDYKGLNVKNKIVIVLRHTPDGDENGKFSPFATIRNKVTTARDQGAAGIILITGPSSDKPEDFSRFGLDASFTDAGIPAVVAKRAFVDALLKPAKKNLNDIQIAAAHGQRQSFAIPGAKIALRTNVVRERGTAENVIGVLEGSDPTLKAENVVIGAHYDHLGMGGEGSLHDSDKPAIHYGADDNASGTAGVLELAQWFGASRERAKRTLIFMGFSGEEIGLLGSAHYVKNPRYPLDRTVAMINMDMIGRSRNDTVQVIGAGTSSAWHPLLKEVNDRHGLQLKTSDSGFGASDQTSFYGRNIPVLFFFTGVHPDYHRPTDTWEKINAEGEAKLLKFIGDVTERIATTPAKPQFVRAVEPAPTTGGAGFGVYLGTIPDYSAEGNGVTLAGVREKSPAEKVGLKGGDVIIQFGKRPIKNVYDYTYALRDAKANVPIDVVVMRGTQKIAVKITPEARR